VPNQAGNPDFRGMVGIVFEPKPAQHVASRIPDDEIAAPPAVAQDDGLGDRDNDGILDKDDACPDDPEVYNGIEDTDGCPDVDRPLVIEAESELVPLQPIEFEFDKDVLRPSAYPILDAVVKALRDNPDFVRIEIQGHTDEQGNDAYNLDLSKRRAATVMRYLTDAGIEAARLTSQGYGETRPVDARHTQQAYAVNRRVAFVIVERR
jgi:outer membrane protein OmpA-like peptidoglycan-associated protein